ncbi:MAG: PH domain-containing protein [Nitrososphaerota archaeon]|nr:PH domain-containing protein [Nitrososphaerota archaeon]
MIETPDDVKKILGSDEEVQIYIRQHFYHPKINVDSVVITNERIILRHPHAVGLKKDYTDFNYRDISNVVMKKGITRSTVSCTLRFGGDPLAMSELRNSDAEEAYGIIRENLARFQAPSNAKVVEIPHDKSQGGTSSVTTTVTTTKTP